MFFKVDVWNIGTFGRSTYRRTAGYFNGRHPPPVLHASEKALPSAEAALAKADIMRRVALLLHRGHTLPLSLALAGCNKVNCSPQAEQWYS
jgi:hypothetical protein